ncbi:MAG TPA: hypothetical protein PLA67_03620 [Bacillota bacterium]|nr:hypothetical protein [Bacillota bacterium]HPZ22452.1 hypothetical protein [Bacillota bacterium]HQD19874.1 hypothetical protein [Bacillota bacterium]
MRKKWIALLTGLVIVVSLLIFLNSNLFVEIVLKQKFVADEVAVFNAGNRTFVTYTQTDGFNCTSVFCEEIKRRLIGWKIIPCGGGVGTTGAYGVGGNCMTPEYQVYWGYTSNHDADSAKLTFDNSEQQFSVNSPLKSGFYLFVTEPSAMPPYNLTHVDFYSEDILLISIQR